MTDKPDFRIVVDQNKYLPRGGREVHAIVSVESSGGPAAARADVDAAEVIIIDTSASMSFPPTKMTSAVAAAQAAVDALRDGVNFAIVAGAERARMVYPADERLVPADGSTRQAAKAALRMLTAHGGTAIGSWLRLADRLFDAHQHGIRHAILLTDGRNQHESPEQLDAALAECVGRFVADCRGVGTDWDVPELRKVASALLGSVDIVADPTGLVADFRAMTEVAMGKSVADVALRVWTPQSATLRFLKQVYPSVEDLTGRRTDVDARSGDYPLGAWGTERREYHICVEVTPGHVGSEMLAARVRPMLGDQVLASAVVLAKWIDDEDRSTIISPLVAHYTGQTELAESIQVGLRAREDGDLDTATARLGRAVALAHESGNEAIAALLSKVVEVDDATTGSVRLRLTVAKVDEMSLDTRSTKTVRTRGAGSRRVREFSAPHEQVPARQMVPARIYLSTDQDHRAVESALEGLLDAYGLKIIWRSAEVYGSWFRQFFTRAKDGAPSVEESVTKIARGIELQALHRPQAEVDAQQADAVAKLMTALEKEENAAIQIGSILLVKVNNNYVVRTLTQLQLAHLERNPELFQDPTTVLHQLQRAAPDNGIRVALPEGLCSCGSGMRAGLCHPKDESGSASEVAN